MRVLDPAKVRKLEEIRTSFNNRKSRQASYQLSRHFIVNGACCL
jgi:hypothetical protein